MRRIVFFIFLAIMLSLPQLVMAEVRLPAIVSSNMVLQRNTIVNIWGWANPHEKISIKASWLKTDIKIEANNDGTWLTHLSTTNSKQAQTIRIQSKESAITLENILFGEVWLCSGQSNMEQAMHGHTGQPTFGALMAIAKSSNSNLRLFTVKKSAAKEPQDKLEKFISWQEASPEGVLSFSAVAYYYGKQLQEILDVPVGLIHASWGGSIVESWMSIEMLNQYHIIMQDEVDLTKQPNHIPSALFNAMINPIVSYTIKGAIWYQGESNRLEPEKYKLLFPAMVHDWRKRWNLGEFPFYYVQIAPYLYGNNSVFQSADNSAFIREAQLECMDLIPNSGMAVTLDLGDSLTIHPPQKKEVADRLLYNALHKTYGFKAVDCLGPAYESMEVNDGGILLNFKDAPLGLFAYDELSGFEIAGADHVFYAAEAKILLRKQVFVKSSHVTNPVAVRYAWRNWTVATLYDTNLLPASSFRTDSWEDAQRAE